jgi:hypothetical protein
VSRLFGSEVDVRRINPDLRAVEVGGGDWARARSAPHDLIGSASMPYLALFLLLLLAGLLATCFL